MARNKYPEVTVNRILDASINLFLQKGYENTTIQDIVDELKDLSKGAIYHHFKSKEDIIEAVIDKLYDNVGLLDQIKNNTSLNGLQKLEQYMYLNTSSTKQKEVFDYCPNMLKNPKLLSRQLFSTMEDLAPILKDFIEEGIKDKSIKLENPKEASEVLAILCNIWVNPAIFKMNFEEFSSKVLFLKQVLDSIGLPVITDRILESLKELHTLISAK